MTSIAASGLGNYGLLGQLGYASEQISATSATLTQQASDGLISDQVARLGTSTGTVLNLQPQLAQLSAYASNGSIATTRLSAASSSLTQLGSIAENLVNNLISLRGESGSAAETTLSTMVSSARNELGEVGTLLNTQAAGSYVFGDGDGSTAPITDANDMTDNALYATAGTAIAGLEANGASATLQTILDAASSTAAGDTPFAAAPASGSQDVLVGSGTQVATSVPIATAVSADASTTSTGSSVRDLVAALSTVANLSTSDLSSDGIDSFLSGISSIASNAQSSLTLQQAQNGASQDIVTSATTAGSTTATLISTQLGDLTSVDAATVATKLTESNDQLQASYMLISDLKSLNLADYL